MNYRAEIDGLRTLALLSVLFYHAEMIIFGNDWFEGGFIGVDIFFVISGYLITRIIISELFEKGTFSFLNFYERRARRILPVLLFVMVVSLPFAWQRLLPSDFVEYSQSILSALFFGSNFYFYFSTTEYGANSALLKPFLHTWSLGIEEQFYIVFPILLIFAYKFLKKSLLILFLVMFLLSLQFAEVMGSRNIDLNFYLPASRFWELLVGSILSFLELSYGRIRNAIASRIFPVIGICLIGYSILFFNSETPHPSFKTLIPIIGVALIIYFSSTKDLVGKILGSKPFVSIGLISYSAYLWHFPIFAFSRISNSAPSNYDKTGWIVATFLLSILSYFFIEQPFRNRKIMSKNRLVSFLLVASLFVIGLQIIIIKNNGFAGRLPEFLSNGFDRKVWNEVKQDGSFCHNRSSNHCIFNSQAEKKLFVVGDSVIGSAMSKIIERFPDYQIVQFTNGACYFSPDTNSLKDGRIRDDQCTDTYQNLIFNTLKQEQKDSVVLIGGQLHNYLDNEKLFRTKNGNPISKEYLLDAVEELSNNPNLKLLFVMPTPQFNGDKYNEVLSKMLQSKEVSEINSFEYSESRSAFDRHQLKVQDFFDLIEDKELGRVISTKNLFCDKVNCYAGRNGQVFMVDLHHFYEQGAKLFTDLIEKPIRETLFLPNQGKSN